MDIKFSEDADLDSAAQSFLVEDLRRIKLSTNLKTYHVRYFIGGKYRIIGYTDNLTAACRYADMAEWRFWKYRTRDAHPPADSDLHFGVDQAKEDWANETEAAVLLTSIEHYLRDSGAIPDYKVVEAERDGLQKRKEARRTVRHDLYSLFADVFTALADIKKCLDVLIDKQSPQPPNFPNEIAGEPVLIGGTDLFKRTSQPPVNDSLIWQKDFIVNVPHPSKPNEVLKKVLIQIPVRVVDGHEIIQPEGLVLIEQTKREHAENYQRIMAQRQDVIDVFSPPTTNQNQTNQQT